MGEAYIIYIFHIKLPWYINHQHSCVVCRYHFYIDQLLFASPLQPPTFSWRNLNHVLTPQSSHVTALHTGRSRWPILTALVKPLFSGRELQWEGRRSWRVAVDPSSKSVPLAQVVTELRRLVVIYVADVRTYVTPCLPVPFSLCNVNHTFTVVCDGSCTLCCVWCHLYIVLFVLTTVYCTYCVWWHLYTVLWMVTPVHCIVCGDTCTLSCVVTLVHCVVCGSSCTYVCKLLFVKAILTVCVIVYTPLSWLLIISTDISMLLPVVPLCVHTSMLWWSHTYMEGCKCAII